ncbi:uncharacterized protein AMSG_07363 [Thecamonas trahens ATCC 50062]|uniref:Uncharacterized protein n=1 Tax=Thecamonas trahens ATCC 50062 TaxID=461836 RepID=A0A0L0DJ40_THETB|nr:hypothetical protein AMSG_07363 [Thecamonas trahens ATCC 50062]KNC51348.1 hypothetical protein AMSG_07363 [Thecamonas trahens ATCC 50062]|eukprot:XP_013756268.1 hypothetical protein AMSG_07363 [Thecamonas trahens ATCC 50062]
MSCVPPEWEHVAASAGRVAQKLPQLAAVLRAAARAAVTASADANAASTAKIAALTQQLEEAKGALATSNSKLTALEAVVVAAGPRLAAVDAADAARLAAEKGRETALADAAAARHDIAAALAAAASARADADAARAASTEKDVEHAAAMAAATDSIVKLEKAVARLEAKELVLLRAATKAKAAASKLRKQLRAANATRGDAGGVTKRSRAARSPHPEAAAPASPGRPRKRVRASRPARRAPPGAPGAPSTTTHAPTLPQSQSPRASRPRTDLDVLAFGLPPRGASEPSDSSSSSSEVVESISDSCSNDSEESGGSESSSSTTVGGLELSDDMFLATSLKSMELVGLQVELARQLSTWIDLAALPGHSITYLLGAPNSLANNVIILETVAEAMGVSLDWGLDDSAGGDGSRRSSAGPPPNTLSLSDRIYRVLDCLARANDELVYGWTSSDKIGWTKRPPMFALPFVDEEDAPRGMLVSRPYLRSALERLGFVFPEANFDDRSFVHVLMLEILVGLAQANDGGHRLPIEVGLLKAPAHNPVAWRVTRRARENSLSPRLGLRRTAPPGKALAPDVLVVEARHTIFGRTTESLALHMEDMVDLSADVLAGRSGLSGVASVALLHPSVSGYMARISYNARSRAQFCVVVSSSSMANAVTVNGASVQLEPVSLQVGDVVAFGAVAYRVESVRGVGTPLYTGKYLSGPLAPVAMAIADLKWLDAIRPCGGTEVVERFLGVALAPAVPDAVVFVSAPIETSKGRLELRVPQSASEWRAVLARRDGRGKSLLWYGAAAGAQLLVEYLVVTLRPEAQSLGLIPPTLTPRSPLNTSRLARDVRHGTGSVLSADTTPAPVPESLLFESPMAVAVARGHTWTAESLLAGMLSQLANEHPSFPTVYALMERTLHAVDWSRTPDILHAAMLRDHQLVMQVLLQARVIDVAVCDKRTRATVVKAALEASSLGCLALILDSMIRSLRMEAIPDLDTLTQAEYDRYTTVATARSGVGGSVFMHAWLAETAAQLLLRLRALHSLGDDAAERLTSARDGKGESLLHWAARLDCKWLAEILLHPRVGMLPDVTASNGASAWTAAVESDSLGVQVALLAASTGWRWESVPGFPSALERDSGNVLHALAELGHWPEMASLEGALRANSAAQAWTKMVKASDRAGNTPLHLAAERGVPVHLAELLLASGAPVNCRNSELRTPLELAMERHIRDTRLAVLLLRHGANLEALETHMLTVRAPITGLSVLHHAASSEKNYDVLERMLPKVESIDVASRPLARGAAARTPFEMARTANALRVLALLLNVPGERGLVLSLETLLELIHLQTPRGKTIMSFACQLGFVHTVARLLAPMALDLDPDALDASLVNRLFSPELTRVLSQYVDAALQHEQVRVAVKLLSVMDTYVARGRTADDMRVFVHALRLVRAVPHNSSGIQARSGSGTLDDAAALPVLQARATQRLAFERCNLAKERDHFYDELAHLQQLRSLTLHGCKISRKPRTEARLNQLSSMLACCVPGSTDENGFRDSRPRFGESGSDDDGGGEGDGRMSARQAGLFGDEIRISVVQVAREVRSRSRGERGSGGSDGEGDDSLSESTDNAQEYTAVRVPHGATVSAVVARAKELFGKPADQSWSLLCLAPDREGTVKLDSHVTMDVFPRRSRFILRREHAVRAGSYSMDLLCKVIGARQPGSFELRVTQCKLGTLDAEELVHLLGRRGPGSGQALTKLHVTAEELNITMTRRLLAALRKHKYLRYHRARVQAQWLASLGLYLVFGVYMMLLGYFSMLRRALRGSVVEYSNTLKAAVFTTDIWVLFLSTVVFSFVWMFSILVPWVILPRAEGSASTALACIGLFLGVLVGWMGAVFLLALLDVDGSYARVDAPARKIQWLLAPEELTWLDVRLPCASAAAKASRAKNTASRMVNSRWCVAVRRLNWRNGLAVLTIGLEFVQLTSLALRPARDVYPWAAHPQRVAKFSLLDLDLGRRGYYAGLGVAGAAALVWWIISAFLGVFSLQNAAAAALTSLPMVEDVSKILSSTLFLLVVVRLLSTLDCTYEGGGAFLDELPEVACWTGLHARLASVGMIGLAYYLFSASFIGIHFTEDHSGKTDIQFAELFMLLERIIKVLVSAFMMFFSSSPGLGLSLLLFAEAALVVVLFKYRPCPFSSILVLKAVSFSMAGWTALCSLLGVWFEIRASSALLALLLIGWMVIPAVAYVAYSRFSSARYQTLAMEAAARESQTFVGTSWSSDESYDELAGAPTAESAEGAESAGMGCESYSYSTHTQTMTSGGSERGGDDDRISSSSYFSSLSLVLDDM